MITYNHSCMLISYLLNNNFDIKDILFFLKHIIIPLLYRIIVRKEIYEIKSSLLRICSSLYENNKT